MDRRVFLGAAGAAAFMPVLPRPDEASAQWVKLPTEPHPGKQDDVFFTDLMTGWYGNRLGRLFKTVDGGQTWIKQLDQPGTFIRALGFIDDRLGFFGNLGAGYAPGITDANPIYRTRDGGVSWEPVRIDGPAMKGVCAIDIFRRTVLNAGVLEPHVTIRAAGRVGGPAFLATSHDAGETWTSQDLSAHTAMILDVHFVSHDVGFICGASNTEVEASTAVILRTDDGGRSWAPAYRGARMNELTWKMSWPSARVGYVTLLNYDPDTARPQRYIAKSIDGGLTWTELLLAEDVSLRTFGVGFLDERRGWVGGSPGGFQTLDGGLSWTPAAMGPTVNRIRILRRPGGGYRVFGIGPELHRLDLSA